MHWISCLMSRDSLSFRLHRRRWPRIKMVKWPSIQEETPLLKVSVAKVSEVQRISAPLRLDRRMATKSPAMRVR